MKFKKSSSEFMQIFDNAKKQMADTLVDIRNMKAVLEDRLSILNESHGYMMERLASLSIQGNTAAINKYVLATSEKYGSFDTYGVTIHPKFLKTPSNILNFMSGTGPIYKDNVTIAVNGEQDDDYKFMLMHDEVQTKGFVLKEYDTDTLEISITMNQDRLLGDTRMNMIEIQPFLSGSFNITSVDIYEVGNETTAAHGLDNVQSVAPMRLMLDEKVAMQKVVFNIKLLHRNSKGKYVFGLKHLYFLNADMSSESYTILKISTRKAIEYIYEDMYIHNQFGSLKKTTASACGAEFYLDYTDGVLLRQVETSTDAMPSYISSNTTSIYVKIPVTTCIVAVILDIRTA